jgi:hypothetical protein
MLGIPVPAIYLTLFGDFRGQGCGYSISKTNYGNRGGNPRMPREGRQIPNRGEALEIKMETKRRIHSGRDSPPVS